MSEPNLQETSGPWRVIHRAPDKWDVVRMRGEEWDSCCGFPLGGLARDVCSALNKAEVVRGVRDPTPHSDAIGDDDIIALVNRLGWDDGMVSIDEIATVREWLREQDDKVAL